VAGGRDRPTGIRVARLEAMVYRVPTERPESDGTFAWEGTTVVVVEATAADRRGVGYACTDASAARLIREWLAPRVVGREAFDVPAIWEDLVASVRNVGRAGIASSAISAIDVALWDLKARLLGLPLVRLLGARREQVACYASGGFTSETPAELHAGAEAWLRRGFRAVKMKVGREPEGDLARVRLVRRALGSGPALYVDANGAYDRKQALLLADGFAELGVTWLEEPVSSDDLAGLRFVRERTRLAVAAGEYGTDARYHRGLLEAQAVDVLQVDATRCLGLSGFLAAAALADVFSIPLSSHTAPAIHLHAACAAPRFLTLEYFHDHARLERFLFDGAVEPVEGSLRPDLELPGLGLELKRREAERYSIRG